MTFLSIINIILYSFYGLTEISGLSEKYINSLKKWKSLKKVLL